MMKSTLKFLLVTCSVFSSIALAQEDQCSGLPEYIAKAIKLDYEHDCQCGSKLHNLKITPIAGMKLVAACSLREWGKGEMIDLSKSRAALDQSPNGLVGDLYFSGEVEVSGRVEVDQTLASNVLVFDSDSSLSNKKNDLGHFMISPDEYRAAFRLEDKFMGAECYSAKAKIRVKGLLIDMVDADNAGAWAIDVRVLHISRYQHCSN